MSPAGFEPAIPAGDRLQTLALDRSATGIGDSCGRETGTLSTTPSGVGVYTSDTQKLSYENLTIWRLKLICIIDQVTFRTSQRTHHTEQITTLWGKWVSNVKPGRFALSSRLLKAVMLLSRRSFLDFTTFTILSGLITKRVTAIYSLRFWNFKIGSWWAFHAQILRAPWNDFTLLIQTIVTNVSWPLQE